MPLTVPDVAVGEELLAVAPEPKATVLSTTEGELDKEVTGGTVAVGEYRGEEDGEMFVGVRASLSSQLSGVRGAWMMLPGDETGGSGQACLGAAGAEF